MYFSDLMGHFPGELSFHKGLFHSSFKNIIYVILITY